MRLQAGQAAPAFAVQDVHGRMIRLDDYRGRYLFLSFYRYASCPFCNLRVHELMQRRTEFKDFDLSLVAVFQSSRTQIMQYVSTQEPPFPILPDPGLHLYRDYRVETSWRGFLIGATRHVVKAFRAMRLGFLPGSMQGNVLRVPADFLIGTRGEILIAYYGHNISDHLPIETVVRQLGALSPRRTLLGVLS